MDLQNKLIIRKRISEKGPYIEGILNKLFF